MALAVTRPARQAGTADLKKRITAGLRELSEQIGVDLPGMTTPQHLIDAARAVEHNNLAGAGRHLDLAVHTLTPQSLYRHGHTDDEAHQHAKAGMYQVARHDLLVKDLQDAHEHNMNAVNISSQARQQQQPQQPAQPAPAAGRRPGANLANARRALELAGPKGYEHGWKYVGGPGLPPPKAKPQFTHGGAPGSWEHAQALKKLGEQFVPGGELAIPYAVSPDADTIKNALSNAARAMVMRRMEAAGVHMDMAIRSARRLGPTQVALLKSARASLAKVPKGAQQMHHELPPGSLARPDISKNPLYVPQYGMGFANRVDLSANTARLAVTPAPLGKPGGPGLYRVKGGKHSDYMEQIVKALIEKRGMNKDRAYKIAYGALRKWKRGGGKVHPEVRAAAGSALAEEAAKGAAARASHGHASSMIAAVELAAQQQQQKQQSSGGWNAAAHPRAAAGSAAGGQFTSGGGGQQSGTNSKKGGGQQLGKAPGKAALLRQASADRERAQALRAQVAALIAVLRGHQPKSSQRSAKSGSSTPAKKGAGAQSSKQAAAGKSGTAAATGKTGTSPARVAKAGPPKMTTAQMEGKVAALRAQIKALLAQAQADTRAAAKA